jgi:alpha-galactosidase
MSLALDIHRDDLEMISLQGGYYNERVYQRAPLIHGNQRICSRRGSTSHHFNPFFMLADKKTTEEKGEAYGFNFVYSGSYLDEVEVCCTGSTRVLVGLGEENFSYLLEAGESFTSPEAVMTYSTKGVGQVSRNMHKFVRSHILPKEKFENRPVVLNSWEAMYFDINEDVLVDFAREAAKCGMDMLVMDDGWFGARINDKAGLGDWFENKDKFPCGLGAFVDRVKAQGVKFGIWIEPEMINPDSDLYRAHPDWAMATPGYEALLSRNQLVLDMANPEVIAYLKDIFAKTFDGVAVDYFKWDMNRNMSAVYSAALPAERQGEAAYRYMLCVYELFRWFGEHFTGAMIENCSGGGGRYDLGMMKYSTQIWTSDNTHPDQRMYIQYGSSFGYPVSVMSCHVAKLEECENPRFLDYRFRLAMNGPLGYELNILKASDAAKANMKAQVEEYRKYEKLILEGDFYRLLNPYETDGKYAYYFVNEDNSEILFSFLQNFGDKKPKEYRLKISRALPNVTYIDKISGRSYEGAELNRGITITTDTEDQYGVMFHFARRKF